MSPWKRSLPRTTTQPQMQKILERNGWVRTLGGKHVVKMVKEGHRPITLPLHRGQPYSRDLNAQIYRQAGLK